MTGIVRSEGVRTGGTIRPEGGGVKPNGFSSLPYHRSPVFVTRLPHSPSPIRWHCPAQNFWGGVVLFLVVPRLLFRGRQISRTDIIRGVRPPDHFFVYFLSLPTHQRRVAVGWLRKFVERRGGDVPPWRLARLVGVARRLAVSPVGSDWGRSMLARRGVAARRRKKETCRESQ